MRLASLLAFGAGKNILEPIARSRVWKSLYWYLMAFGVLFWVAFLWGSYYYANAVIN